MWRSPCSSEDSDALGSPLPLPLRVMVMFCTLTFYNTIVLFFSPNSSISFWFPSETVNYSCSEHVIMLIWRCVYHASYCSVLMTNEMHSSHNQFYSTVFCLLYMFRTNLVVHHQERGLIHCITQSGTIVQASLAALKQLDAPARLCQTV